MANRISVIVDLVTDKATTGLKGFKASINDADGAVGKFKAGASSAFGSIQQHAGQLAVAGGAALVAFGVKAVTAFTDSALSAGKFADATGLSTETASKWVAVADDIGISSESMEKGFGKLAVAVGKNNPLLEEYGITVQKNAHGQMDMNATMLNAIDVIKGIQDPTKKAAVAQAALGKGWMDMAELIDQGSTSLTKSMGEVSEAQIIDPKEVEKAKKMREATDALQDAVGDLAVAFGEELVPKVAAATKVLIPLINAVSDVTAGMSGGTDIVDDYLGKFKSANPELESFVGTQEQFATALRQAGLEVDDIDEAVTRFGATIKSAQESQTKNNESMSEYAGLTSAAAVDLDHLDDRTQTQTHSTESLTAAEEKATEARQAASDATKDATDALEDQIKATDDLYESKIALVGGDIAVRDSQRQAAEAVAALNALTKEGKEGTEEFEVAQDAAAQSLLDSAGAAAEYEIAQREANGETLSGQSKADLFKQKLIELAGTLAPGSPLLAQLLGYIDALGHIPAEVVTNLRITGATVTAGGDLIRPGQRASGGPVAPGHSYIVGEEGPELLTMGASAGVVTPNGALGGGGGSLTVNINGGLIDQRTIEQIAREWDRWKRGLS